MSIRGALDFGQRNWEGHKQFVGGVALRGDAMFGAPRPRAFRLGPAFELRSMKLETVEAALGAGILIPLPGDCPIGLTGLIGSAARKGLTPDGLIGIGTVTWGFRGYNYNSWYGYGLNLFFSGRKHLGEEHLVEMTAGVEVDIVFTTLIPGRAIYMWLKGGDPLED
ncbi:MAG: hypothetical protein ABW252_00665 [Polyangiales bacterium]